MNGKKKSPFTIPGPRFIARPFELFFGLAGMDKVYKKILEMPPERGFFRNCADVMGFEAILSDSDRAHVPSTGPVVFTANHPTGMAEGVMALALLREIRPDVKALGMTFLSRVPEMAEAFFSVDVFSEGKSAAAANKSCAVQAAHWLEQGHAVLAFPAGVVAHRSWKNRCHLKEEPWRAGALRLAARTGAKVVPVGFGLRTRFRWNLAGLVHPLLRTANLPNEFLAKRNSKIPVRIGEPQDPPGENAAEYMRVRSLVLAKSADSAVERASTPPPPKEPVAPPEDQAILARELESLPPETLLIPDAGPYRVWLAPAKLVPHVLAETGRLREITFRANAEGTGLARDLDKFDEDYLHLVLWDAEKKCIAGGSRLADAADLLARKGPQGLYTRTLFEFDKGLFDRLGGSFELGRTFITAEYQRDYMPLYLIWKALYVYFQRRPEVRTLFGTVSIPASVPPSARALMAAGLMAAHGDRELAALVKSPHPPSGFAPEEASTFLSDAAAFARIARDATPDGRGFPVLLRHYLKLGGRFAAFSEDPLFGDCLDGFVFVDLSSPGVERFIRMMGKSAARASAHAAAAAK